MYLQTSDLLFNSCKISKCPKICDQKSFLVKLTKYKMERNQHLELFWQRKKFVEKRADFKEVDQNHQLITHNNNAPILLCLNVGLLSIKIWVHDTDLKFNIGLKTAKLTSRKSWLVSEVNNQSWRFENVAIFVPFHLVTFQTDSMVRMDLKRPIYVNHPLLYNSNLKKYFNSIYI